MGSPTWLGANGQTTAAQEMYQQAQANVRNQYVSPLDAYKVPEPTRIELAHLRIAAFAALGQHTAPGDSGADLAEAADALVEWALADRGPTEGA